MENILHFIQAGGFVMYPLILLSLGAIAVIIERAMTYSAEGRALGTTAVDGVIESASRGDLDAARRGTKDIAGVLGDSLRAVLDNSDRDVESIERHVNTAGQAHFVRMERFLPFLDTATTISPLLGLLGTIVGMIGTFNAISTATTRGAGTDAILAGVGEALYATATGLTIAVVCFVAYNFFAARLKSITETTELAVSRLINAVLDSRAEPKR